MKKRLISLFVIMIAMLFAVQVMAFDADADADAPTRRVQSKSFLEKRMFSLGIIGAVKLKTDILDDLTGDKISGAEEDNVMYLGLSARLFPFAKGKLGIGLDIIILDWYEDEVYDYKVVYGTIDLDVLYRMKIGRRLVLNGGLGWSTTFINVESSGYSTTEYGAAGFNVKVGAEFFITRYISLSFDYKWTFYTIGYEEINGSQYYDTVHRTHSVQFGAHYWF